MPSSPRSATTSVAPNSSPRSVRSLCRPIKMICSAPSRFADRTAHRPTAPSPMTVTVVLRPTPAVTAQWWPVGNTSESVSSPGSSAESSPTGTLTRVPCACGTRTASPWPASTPLRPRARRAGRRSAAPPGRSRRCCPPRRRVRPRRRLPSGRRRPRRRPPRRRGTRGPSGCRAPRPASSRTATGRCRRCSHGARGPRRRWAAGWHGSGTSSTRTSPAP